MTRRALDFFFLPGRLRRQVNAEIITGFMNVLNTGKELMVIIFVIRLVRLLSVEVEKVCEPLASH